MPVCLDQNAYGNASSETDLSMYFNLSQHHVLCSGWLANESSLVSI